MQTDPDAKYLVLISEQQRQILINALGGVVNDEDENEADLLLGMFKGDGGLQADSDDKDVVNDFTC